MSQGIFKENVYPLAICRNWKLISLYDVDTTEGEEVSQGVEVEKALIVWAYGSNLRLIYSLFNKKTQDNFMEGTRHMDVCFQFAPCLFYLGIKNTQRLSLEMTGDFH